jgi:hypothetical protein
MRTDRLVKTREGEDNWQRDGNDLGLTSKFSPHLYPAIDPDLKAKLKADAEA